ncbi:hypothetical protein L4C38_20375 [Vibrio kasasachensis]|uniref:hypothetical protein n=1 Tax=Vibrio kasasachensis TaxID=2910248 RepID=UPI003D0F1444
MKFLESWDQLEEQEELLRQRVNSLNEEQRKRYYKIQAKKLKDPDTYASMNWFFLGGFHHLYLGKHILFAIEITLLLMSVISLYMGYELGIYILVILALYELPHLFFAQKIARQHNYEISSQIYNDVNSSK